MMMKLLIVLQVLSWWQTFSSSDLLEESPSNQRHCCSGLSSSTDTATANAALTECLEQQVEQDLLLASPQSTGPKLLYVTYYTPAIRDHALFAYAVNSHHASLHGANMHLLSPQTKHDYDRNDQRWNKVKILHDYIKDILLQRSCRQQLASFCQHFEQHPVVEYDYILWLDADLIINNQSFSFNNDVIQKYATADIVISLEINPLNGIANTGSMLVKVSPWTMRFLDIWWDTDAYWTQVSPGQGRLPGSSRIDGMDQHVLDFLYKQYDHLFRTAIVDHPQLSIQDHIVLLEMNAINSEFPGLKTFQEDQPVLHIAGESNFIRRHILRHAWQRLCQQPPEDNMAELLVKKHFLENIDYIALHGEEWNAINEELREVQHNEEATELRNSQVQQWTAMLPKVRISYLILAVLCMH